METLVFTSKKQRTYRSLIALPRAHGPDMYRIMRNNGTIDEIDAHTFDVKHGFASCMRILEEEYANIDNTLPYFTHFNLEFAGNPVGGKMFLPHILVQGYFRAAGDEVLPILSFTNVYTGVVTHKREHVPYKALHDEIFQYSMKHIQNVTDLKKAILRRYRVSMPNLSDEEILRRGVGITTIHLEDHLLREFLV
jgi:hypothetical protein